MYVEITSTAGIRRTVEYIKSHYHATDVQVTPPRSGMAGSVGIEVNILPASKQTLTPSMVAIDLEQLEEVVFALESI